MCNLDRCSGGSSYSTEACLKELSNESSDIGIFWKEVGSLVPGDVFFYSQNSCVMCVSKNCTNKVSVGKLNPNATVFHSKAEPVGPENTVEGFKHMNGDAGKSSPPADSDYSTLNGNQDSQSVTSADSEQSSEISANHDDQDLTELKAMLLHQLEYYFSRENLNHDSYLVSQMDADQYVPISTVANFNQVKKLSADLALIVEVLRGSQNVQVDDKGEKVRPLTKRCIVILRDIADGTTLQQIKDLFSGANSPKFSSVEFAHNNSWYITFESDEDAQKAYRYLREDIKSFKGKPIMARIKAKPLVSTSYTPKNGLVKVPLSPYDVSPSVKPSPTFQHQQNLPLQSQQRFTYPQPVNLNFLAPQQVQQSFNPFYPPTSTMIPTAAWPTSPPSPFFDPGMTMALNGFQAQGYHKLTNSVGRQGFQLVRNRNQPKIHNRAQSNPERSPTDNVRHMQANLVNSAPTPGRPSPRGDGADGVGQALFKTSLDTAYNPQPLDSPPGTRQTDTAIRDQHKRTPNNIRPRRRKDDEGARLSRPSSSQPTTKETPKPVIEEKFELEQNSFPPLPGTTSSATAGDGEVFESKMSDVVRGTAKLAPRHTENKSVAQASSQSSKESTPSPLTTGASTSQTTSTTTTNAATTTPPQSPKKMSNKSTSTSTSTETSTVKLVTTPPPKEQANEPKSPEPSNANQRPSYAEMAQRARERAAKEATEKVKEDQVNNNKDNNKDSAQDDTVNKPALKEQTTKTQTGKLPKESRSDPKDHRPGRKNKENHDRRDRVERERRRYSARESAREARNSIGK